MSVFNVHYGMPCRPCINNKKSMLPQGNRTIVHVIYHNRIPPGISAWSRWSKSVLLCQPVVEDPGLIFMQLFSKLYEQSSPVSLTNGWTTCRSITVLCRASCGNKFVISAGVEWVTLGLVWLYYRRSDVTAARYRCRIPSPVSVRLPACHWIIQFITGSSLQHWLGPVSRGPSLLRTLWLPTGTNHRYFSSAVISICNFWHLGTLIGCQKLQMTAWPCLAQDAL